MLCKSQKVRHNMSDTHTRDLTTGSPMRLILSFMVPLIFGLLFQQFYSMVDTIVVGKFLGVDALAGVGSTGSINFLVLGLCNGVCAGFAIPVAQKFGQKDYDGLRRFVGNMVWLSSVIALAVTLVTTLLCRRILVWMDTPEDTPVPFGSVGTFRGKNLERQFRAHSAQWSAAEECDSGSWSGQKKQDIRACVCPHPDPGRVLRKYHLLSSA